MIDLKFKHVGDKNECVIGSWSNFDAAVFEFNTRKHYYETLELSVIMVSEYHMKVYSRVSNRLMLTEKLTLNS